MLKNKIHFWLKPGLNFVGSVMKGNFNTALKEKDRVGWDNETIRKLRSAFREWEVTIINDGKTDTKCGRPPLRQIFDMVCLCGEVEGTFTDQRIKIFLKLCNKHGL